MAPVSTKLLLASLLGALPACRAGLPPEPPGADPADANGAAPMYHPPPNPYEVSAFAGEPADTPDAHAGHNMGHGAMPGMNMNADHEGMGHGTTGAAPPAAPPAGSDHAGHMSGSAPKAGTPPAAPPPAKPPTAPAGSGHAGHMSGSAPKAGTPPAAPPAAPAESSHAGMGGMAPKAKTPPAAPPKQEGPR